MCNHSNTKRVGELKVCLKCGMTVLPNGQIFFDRELPNYKSKKTKKRKAVKKIDKING